MWRRAVLYRAANADNIVTRRRQKVSPNKPTPSSEKLIPNSKNLISSPEKTDTELQKTDI
jgi:hypothetical protein